MPTIKYFEITAKSGFGKVFWRYCRDVIGLYDK